MFGINTNGVRFIVLAIAAGLTVAGCQRQGSTSPTFVAKIVETQKQAPASAWSLQTQKLATAGPEGVNSAITSSTNSITTEVSLKKAALFDRDFLYGADLQYSSFGQDDMFLQSLAIGHEIVRFRTVGNKLQMIANQNYLFESDINHPPRLVAEFDIVNQAPDQLTIKIASASPILSIVLDAKNPPALRQSWVRSVQFVEQGEYLLFESTVELANGKILEFMESVFPRDSLVPKQYQPLLADSGREPLAERYRFLTNGKIWMDFAEGRAETSVAYRFNIEGGKTLDWYVTPNVPTEYVRPIQLAVEGWNRYFQKMLGRDVMVFKGKLPADVRIGDPRYNVINWDSVEKASSAYESQATDPLTGIQSHSLIYLPRAWAVIGREFWEKGGYSHDREATSIAVKSLTNNLHLLGNKHSPSCFRDIQGLMSLKARTTPDEFAESLLKGTLFHELGHALGLAHNFKGSLIFDPDAKNPSVTTSIMDYNQYHLEEDAFFKVDSADGPLLEYDRQILSALYNNAKDVQSADPILPACNDEEADDVSKGVDALCTRYDAGNEPTVMLQKIISLLGNESAQSYKMDSLPKAIRATTDLLQDPSTVTTDILAGETLGKLAAHVDGTIAYYYSAGAQGLRYMLGANIKTLRISSTELPPEFDIAAMRMRVIQSVQYVVNSADLEPSVYLAIGDVKNAALAWLQLTPWYQGLAVAQQTELVTHLTKALQTSAKRSATLVTSSVRAQAFQNLSQIETAPYFYDGTAVPVDFEKFALDVLEFATTSRALSNGSPRPVSERILAATSLKSFTGIHEGEEAIGRALSQIQGEVARAKTAEERAALRKLIAILKQKA